MKTAKVITLNFHNGTVGALPLDEGVVSKGNKVEPFIVPMKVFPMLPREDMHFDYSLDKNGKYIIHSINTQI